MFCSFLNLGLFFSFETVTMIVFFIPEWLDRIFLIPPAPETVHLFKPVPRLTCTFMRVWLYSRGCDPYPFFTLFLKVGSHSELSYHQGRTTQTHILFRVHLSPFVLSIRRRKCHSQMSCLHWLISSMFFPVGGTQTKRSTSRHEEQHVISMSLSSPFRNWKRYQRYRPISQWIYTSSFWLEFDAFFLKAFSPI